MYDISVVNPDNQSGMLTGAFTVSQAPTDGSTVTQASVAVVGVLDEPATVSVNGDNLGLVSAFNTPLTLPQGANALTITASDTSFQYWRCAPIPDSKGGRL